MKGESVVNRWRMVKRKRVENVKRRGLDRIELSTSRTLSENHTTRPKSLNFDVYFHVSALFKGACDGRAGALGRTL
jgi:hypothetical protein